MPKYENLKSGSIYMTFQGPQSPLGITLGITLAAQLDTHHILRSSQSGPEPEERLCHK